MSKISDATIGVALEAFDQKLGYSKIERMRAALEAAFHTHPSTAVKTLMTVEEYVDGYCWRGDDGDYTPNEHEKALLIDALHGAVEEVSADFVFASRHNDGTGQCEAVDIGSTTLRKLREKLSAKDCEVTP